VNLLYYRHKSLTSLFASTLLKYAVNTPGFIASKFRRLSGLALPSVFSHSDQLQVTNIKEICSAFLVSLKEIYRCVIWNTLETLQRWRKGQSYNGMKERHDDKGNDDYEYYIIYLLKYLMSQSQLQTNTKNNKNNKQLHLKQKLKEPLYRPGQALRVPVVRGSQISKQ